MGLNIVIGATVVVLGFGALGVGALIINPRVLSHEGTTMLLSCNFRQMFLIPSDKMDEEIGLSAGLYTPASLTSNLLVKVMDNYKKQAAGHSFVALGAGVMAMLTPVLESAVESTIDDVCSGREPSIARILDVVR